MIEKKTAEQIYHRMNDGLDTTTDWVSEQDLIKEFTKFKKWVLETTYGDYTIQLEQYFDKFQKELERVKE